MENKFSEIRKHDIQNRIDNLSEKIRYNTEKQAILLEYNQYERNTHIGLGIIIAVTTFFVTKTGMNIELVKSLILTGAVALTVSFSTKIYSKVQRKKLKKQNPNIDFDIENIDNNYEKINHLFEQKFLLVEELGSLNNEFIEASVDSTNEVVDEMVNEKTKQKILKRM